MTPAATVTTAVMVLCLVIVALFVALGERWATPAALAPAPTSASRPRERRRRPHGWQYLAEPHRALHSQTQEMEYLLAPYRDVIAS